MCELDIHITKFIEHYLYGYAALKWFQKEKEKIVMKNIIIYGKQQGRIPAGGFRGGEQQERIPAGGFRGGEQQERIPAGGFRGGEQQTIPTGFIRNNEHLEIIPV